MFTNDHVLHSKNFDQKHNGHGVYNRNHQSTVIQMWSHSHGCVHFTFTPSLWTDPSRGVKHQVSITTESEWPRADESVNMDRLVFTLQLTIMSLTRTGVNHLLISTEEQNLLTRQVCWPWLCCWPFFFFFVIVFGCAFCPLNLCVCFCSFCSISPGLVCLFVHYFYQLHESLYRSLSSAPFLYLFFFFS